MITFSPTISAILAGPLIEAIQLVKIGPYFSCAYFRNLTISNGDVYLADGNLLSADSPQSISVVAKDTFNVAFADPDMVYGAFAEEGLIGKLMEVNLCFIDPATKLPLTNLADLLLIYKGKVSATSYKIDTNIIGSSAFFIEGSSPMSDLDFTRAFYTSKAFIQNINFNDTCFDQVYEGAGPVNIRWGK